MSSLNINTLFEEADKKYLNRLKLFDDILVQIHNRIKYHSKNKWFYCTYSLPEFLIGKPLYKIVELRKYIKSNIIKKESKSSSTKKRVSKKKGI